jgi:hypothetical protein
MVLGLRSTSTPPMTARETPTVPGTTVKGAGMSSPAPSLATSLVRVPVTRL